MYFLDENIKNLDRIFDQNRRGGYLRLAIRDQSGNDALIAALWELIGGDLMKHCIDNGGGYSSIVKLPLPAWKEAA